MKTINSGQPNLFAARGDRSKRPTGAASLVPRFLDTLRGRGWVAGAILAKELGADLRTLRSAAHESGGRILGGDKGYSLTIQASLEDVTAVVNRHYSQSRAMRERAMEIERVRHGGIYGVASVTATESCAVLVDTVRELSATRAECDSWRMLAVALLEDASALRRELAMIDQREYVFRTRIQDDRDVFVDQRDLRLVANKLEPSTEAA